MNKDEGRSIKKLTSPAPPAAATGSTKKAMHNMNRNAIVGFVKKETADILSIYF